MATGQTGKNPYICVWDSSSNETVSILKDGHQNGIGALGFDKEGQVLGTMQSFIKFCLGP